MRDNILIAEIKRIVEQDTKKIIIWGTANIGAFVYAVVKALGREVEFFVDSNKDKEGELFYNTVIKMPYEIVYENLDEIKVILAFTNAEQVESIVKEMGLQFEYNVFDLKKIEQPKICNLIDPFLGYSRTDDVEGFRIYKGKGKKKIVVLGGSTSDYSVSGIKSWPEILYELLKTENYDYDLYNGAIVGYYSGQELFKCIRDCVSLEPDIIVSYSGVNDADFVKTDIHRPYIPGYLFDIYEKHIKNKVDIRSAVNDKGTIGYGICSVESAADFWVNNMRMMQSICREFDIKFYSFIQPTMFYGNYNISDLEREILSAQYTDKYLEDAFNFFDDVVKKSMNIEYIYDFTHVLDGMDGIFYDAMHLDEEGNDIIAHRILDTIKPEL